MCWLACQGHTGNDEKEEDTGWKVVQMNMEGRRRGRAGSLGSGREIFCLIFAAAGREIL